MTHKKFPQREHVLPDMFCYVSFNVCTKDKRKELCRCTSQAGIHGDVEVYRNQHTTQALEEGGS